MQMPVGPAALLWDVDGTLAETELDGHRVAFNRAFEEAGLPWFWDVPLYQRLVRTSGGRERIAAYLEEVEGKWPDRERVEQLQAAKQRAYNAMVAAGALTLRPGVERLLRSAAQHGVPQAIVTTSSRLAVQALLDQHARHVAHGARLRLGHGREAVAELLGQHHLDPGRLGPAARGGLAGGHGMAAGGPDTPECTERVADSIQQ